MTRRKSYSAEFKREALRRANEDEFRWLAGEDLLTSYIGEHGFGLQSCSKCGSTLCGVHKGTIHGVALGCLSSNPDVEIGRHIFVGSKASWDVIPGGIVTFEEGAPVSE